MCNVWYSGLLSKLRIKYQSKDLHNNDFNHKQFIRTMTYFDIKCEF